MSEAKAKPESKSDATDAPAKESKRLGKEIKIGLGVISLLGIVLAVLVVRRLSGPQTPPTAAIPPAVDPRAEELLGSAVQSPTILPATSGVDISQPFAIDSPQATESWQGSPQINDADAAASRRLMPQQTGSAGNEAGQFQSPATNSHNSYDLPSRYAAPVNDGLNTIPTPSYRDSTAVESDPTVAPEESFAPEGSLAADTLPADAALVETTPTETMPAETAPLAENAFGQPAVPESVPADFSVATQQARPESALPIAVAQQDQFATNDLETADNAVPNPLRVDAPRNAFSQADNTGGGSFANDSRPITAQPLASQPTATRPPAAGSSSNLIPNENLRFTSPGNVASTNDRANTPSETPLHVAQQSPAVPLQPSTAAPTELPATIEQPIAILEPQVPNPTAEPLAAAPITAATSASAPIAASQVQTAQQPPAAAPPASRYAAPQADPNAYQIVAGDNFWSISEKLYGTDAYFKALYEHNRNAVIDPNRLSIGSQLAAPPLAELQRLYPALCPPRSTASPVSVAATRPTTPAPTNPTPSEPQARGTYVSTQGDTLYDIARQELGDGNLWPQIYDLNRKLLGNDLDYLAPGTQLVMPSLPTNPARPAAQLSRQPGGAARR